MPVSCSRRILHDHKAGATMAKHPPRSLAAAAPLGKGIRTSPSRGLQNEIAQPVHAGDLPVVNYDGRERRMNDGGAAHDVARIHALEIIDLDYPHGARFLDDNRARSALGMRSVRGTEAEGLHAK